MPPLEDLSEFCDKMTMSGSKVESFEITGQDISKVVTGRIVSIERHPDADKLIVCQLDVGDDEPIQIVTGADNVSDDYVVPVALHKSTLPGGVKIKKGKLRGIVSNGMLCSGIELGLTSLPSGEDPAAGILILDKDVPLGIPIQDVLGFGDGLIEFEITSNRPDCYSMEGLGREAALTLDQPFTPREPKVKGEGGQRTDSVMKIVNSAPDLCYRYAGRLVTDVKIEPSPEWMQSRLRDAGVRPINNIVDITNYCMLELGQPMHAFDLSYLKGGVIEIRRAKNGEQLTTLDESEHELDESMLVIADGCEAIALAGVMGGLNSEVKSTTTAVFFESAVFDSVSVRHTAQKTGLRTESSSRYEKGADRSGAVRSLNRACELVEELNCGKVAPDYLDCLGDDQPARDIVLRPAAINRLLGTEIDGAWMGRLLLNLGCELRDQEQGLYRMPTYRPDLECEADLAEEVARFYGYNKIPSTCSVVNYDPRWLFQRSTDCTQN